MIDAARPGQLPLLQELRVRFPEVALDEQPTQDGTPTCWVAAESVRHLLAYLQRESPRPFPMLFDLTAVDERVRLARPAGVPRCDFSLLYQLLSPERNETVRLRVPLQGESPAIATVTDLWPAARWYEREAWDMFGIRFPGHDPLRRLLLPDYWQGHPLRKEHPARRTELAPYRLSASPEQERWEGLQFRPEDFDFAPPEPGSERMHLSLGPHHPGTHGLIRFVLELEGEQIQDVGLQIGFHHRGQEKLAERQTFHTYLPYTDRIDYLAGFGNEFPYVLAVEQLAGIPVPPRAQAIRVMLAELFRIANHLVYLGTYGGDLGAQSPIFWTFNDRERVLAVIEAIAGFRMHPGWFRIGGVAADLPSGWEALVEDVLRQLPRSLAEYRRGLLGNSIFSGRARGIGAYTTEQALAWGITGPNLRATGLPWDLRRARPYSGYEQFDFEVVTGSRGDSLERGLMRLEEMAQSLRIIAQAAHQLPSGPIRSEHPLATPPLKAGGTMVAIETLIHHFVGVSWGKPWPVGEAQVLTEAPKGNMAFHLLSDGNVHSYRTRIRTPTFPLLQTIPWLSKGLMVSDLITILGSIDYVMGDVDR